MHQGSLFIPPPSPTCPTLYPFPPLTNLHSVYYYDVATIKKKLQYLCIIHIGSFTIIACYQNSWLSDWVDAVGDRSWIMWGWTVCIECRPTERTLDQINLLSSGVSWKVESMSYRWWSTNQDLRESCVSSVYSRVAWSARSCEANQYTVLHMIYSHVCSCRNTDDISRGVIVVYLETRTWLPFDSPRMMMLVQSIL